MYSRDSDMDSKESEVQQLRPENALIYTRPSNVALVDRRVFKTYNFSNNSYELGSTMQIIVNSGGDAVWGRSSYIRLQYTTGGNMDFGTGSILNIFKSIRLTHRSGEVLEYVDNVNLVANLTRFWHYSVDDRRKLDGMLNNDTLANTAANSYTNVQDDGVHVACIPMSILCGLFNSENQYMPATLCAGMKIELELAPLTAISTQPSNPTATLMTITDMKPTLVLDTAQLYDVINKQLLEEQAQVDRSGIQFSYFTYFNSFQVIPAGVTSVNFDIQQSASLVHKILVAVRDNRKLTTNVPGNVGVDKYTTIAPFNTAQFRLGSLYMPQQIVSVPALVPATPNWDDIQLNAKEWYNYGLVAHMAAVDEFHKSAGGSASITYQEYTTSANVPDGNQWVSGKAVYAFTGEKSAVSLMLTGEPTNNSRLLNFSASISSLLGAAGAYPATNQVAPAYYNIDGGLRVDYYLQYLRCANLMGDNCVVDR